MDFCSGLLTHWESRPAFGLIYFFIGAGFLVAELSTATFPVAMIRSLPANGTTWRWAAVTWQPPSDPQIPTVLVAVGCGECLSYLAGAPAGLMSLVVVGLSIDGFYFSALTALEEYRMTIVYRCLANAAQTDFSPRAVAVVAGSRASVWCSRSTRSFTWFRLPPLSFPGGQYAPFVGDGDASAMESESLRRLLFRPSRLAYLMASSSAETSFLVRLLAPQDSATYGAARALAVPLIIAPTAIGTVVQPETAGAPPEEQWAMLRRVVGAGIGIAVIGSLVIRSAGRGRLSRCSMGTGMNKPRRSSGLLPRRWLCLECTHCCSIGVSALDSRVCRQSASAFRSLDRGGSRVFHSPYARGAVAAIAIGSG